jgi:hypothetical protein
MENNFNYQYLSNAPCAMCFKQGPNTHTKVSLSYSINSTYKKTVEYTVPVCVQCKKRYEAQYIFGFQRMVLKSKVRKWLQIYRIRSKENQVQTSNQRNGTLAFLGWIMTLISSVMILGSFGAYFSPTPEEVQKSQQMTFAWFIISILLFGFLLYIGIKLIRKSIILRRQSKNKS